MYSSLAPGSSSVPPPSSVGITGGVASSLPAGMVLLAVSSLLSPSRANGLTDVVLRPSSHRTIASLVHSLRSEIPEESAIADPHSPPIQSFLRTCVDIPTDVLGALRASWLSRRVPLDEVFIPNLYLIPDDDPREREEMLLYVDMYTSSVAMLLNRFEAVSNAYEMLDRFLPKRVTNTVGSGVLPSLLLGETWADPPTTQSIASSGNAATAASRKPLDHRLVSKQTVDLFSQMTPLRYQEFLSLTVDCTMSLSCEEFHSPQFAARLVNTAHMEYHEFKSRAKMALYRYNDHREPRGLRERRDAAVKAVLEDRRSLIPFDASSPSSSFTFPRILQTIVKDDTLLKSLGFVLDSPDVTSASSSLNFPRMFSVLHVSASVDDPTNDGSGHQNNLGTAALTLFTILESFPLMTFCNRLRFNMAEDYVQQRSKRQVRTSSIFEEYADAFAGAVMKFAPMLFPMELRPSVTLPVANSVTPANDDSSKVTPTTAVGNASSVNRDIATSTLLKKEGEKENQKPLNSDKDPPASSMTAPPPPTLQQSSIGNGAQASRSFVTLQNGVQVVQPTVEEILRARRSTAALLEQQRDAQHQQQQQQPINRNTNRNDEEMKMQISKGGGAALHARDPHDGLLSDIMDEYATLMQTTNAALQQRSLPRQSTSVGTEPAIHHRDHTATTAPPPPPLPPAAIAAAHYGTAMGSRPYVPLTPAVVSNVVIGGPFPHRTGNYLSTVEQSVRLLQRAGRGYRRRRDCAWLQFHVARRGLRQPYSQPAGADGSSTSQSSLAELTASSMTSRDPTIRRLVALNGSRSSSGSGGGLSPLPVTGGATSTFRLSLPTSSLLLSSPLQVRGGTTTQRHLDLTSPLAFAGPPPPATTAAAAAADFVNRREISSSSYSSNYPRAHQSFNVVLPSAEGNGQSVRTAGGSQEVVVELPTHPPRRIDLAVPTSGALGGSAAVGSGTPLLFRDTTNHQMQSFSPSQVPATLAGGNGKHYQYGAREESAARPSATASSYGAAAVPYSRFHVVLPSVAPPPPPQQQQQQRSHGESFIVDSSVFLQQQRGGGDLPQRRPPYQ